MAHAGTGQRCFAPGMAGSDYDDLILGRISVQEFSLKSMRGKMFHVEHRRYILSNLPKIIYFLISPGSNFVNHSFLDISPDSIPFSNQLNKLWILFSGPSERGFL
jgi:hypothetical protein